MRLGISIRLPNMWKKYDKVIEDAKRVSKQNQKLLDAARRRSTNPRSSKVGMDHENQRYNYDLKD